MQAYPERFAHIRPFARIRAAVLTAGISLAVIAVVTRSIAAGAVGFGLIVIGALVFRHEVKLAGIVLAPPVVGVGQMDHVEVDTTLDKLLKNSAVAEVWSAAPERFEQINFLDQFTHGAWPKEEVPQYVYLESAYGEWSIAFADELFANLDLDADDSSDPMCQVLRADPRVIEAWHDNREVYTVKATSDMTKESFAVLAVRGFIAHHLEARRRLLGA